MIKVIDTSFYSNNECSDLSAIIMLHQPALGYVNHLPADIVVEVIKHLDFEGVEIINDIKYTCFKGRNSFAYIPLKTMRYISKQAPDIVIVQGFSFPLQVICLKKMLGSKTRILLQHHGETPFNGFKKWLQKIADRYVAGYLFTSLGNGSEWIKKRIIEDKNKCFELLEASTPFKKQDKVKSKKQLSLTGNFNFLWVGRLTRGKDPLTILAAFEQFSVTEPSAKLFMIYQTEELLPAIKAKIANNGNINEKVFLVGKLPHDELERWYSAADFYISGSHHEGSGYALLEAMACGCIPVVTNIPSFNKITANGQCGILYPVGDAEALLNSLKQLYLINRETMIYKILDHFNEELSFKAIGRDLYAICKTLIPK